jgi:excisionase family DNA binding protein
VGKSFVSSILAQYFKTKAVFLGVSPSLVYAYVERKQIPHYRMMGRTIRFRVSELEKWRQQFHVNGGIHEQSRKATEQWAGLQTH